MHNTAQNPPIIAVADIKEKAREQAAKAARGASALSLVKAARNQTLEARQCELAGDLKGALEAYIKAATLAKLCMDSAEFRAEIQPGKHGVLYKEFTDFTQNAGLNLQGKAEALASKLEEMERSNGAESSKGGGSIADRMRSLQEAGLSLNTTNPVTSPPATTNKRFSHQPVPTTPISPTTVRNRYSNSSLSSASASNISSAPSASSSSAPSPHAHAFVPLSSLGPPSPTSSPPSSPPVHNHNFDLTEFAQHFPSIDELDEVSANVSMHNPKPNTRRDSISNRRDSISTRRDSISTRRESTSTSTIIHPHPSAIDTTPTTHINTGRDGRRDGNLFAGRPFNFPILPVDPGPGRPSSTPNTPTLNSFASRPVSPAPIPPTRAEIPFIHAAGQERERPIPPPIIPSARPSSPFARPSSPFASSSSRPHTPILRRPSGLGLSSPTAAMPSPPSLPPSTLPPQEYVYEPTAAPAPDSDFDELSDDDEAHDPVTSSIFPRALRALLRRRGYKVLLLDVRTRAAFDVGHVKADAVVCVEESVLLRGTVTGQTIEDSLAVAPRHEWALFTNREKFDLVVLYDNASEAFGPAGSPLAALVKAIYETAFRKMLKKAPVQLVGGFEAWKKEFGREGVEGGEGGDERKGVDAEAEGAGAGGEHRKPPPPPPPKPLQQPIAMPKPTPILEPPSRYWTPPSAPQDAGNARHSLPPRSEPGYVNGHVTGPGVLRRPLTHKPSSISLSMSLSSSSASSIPPTPIQYPQFPKAISPSASGPSAYSTHAHSLVSPPPQASINPTFSRRRSDYIDPVHEALSRAPIDYPELSARSVLRPPPAAASSAMERQDNRPRIMQDSSSLARPSSGPGPGPAPPTIKSDYPVTYWSDTQIGTSGLKNLGNTCYMNATIQCLSATVPFARFFTDGRWKSAVNMVNPMGTKGNLAHAFADIVHEMWQGELPYLSPYTFRRSLTAHASQFGGSDQHDSQEFLSFLLDGLHEDLNRILHKPTWQPSAEEEAELERLPQQIASDQQWQIYRMRNDSLIVDFFQGQFRNRLECLTCHKTSTTYNSFMYLTLPVPSGRNMSKVSLTQCLDAFVKSEVMEKTDAWHCPNCKTLRRATKQLSLSRLPPVLLIHLKRFSVQGPFTDKLETLVDFPLRSLDLTNYMPAPLPPGIDKSQLNGGNRLSSSDPRAQVPPYKYDLYGVTNHSGNLSNGHYTAFIASRGGWLYCDDSRVQPTEASEVVGRRAYVLFYKRTKS